MPVEEVKPLTESDLYSRFQDLGGLFELLQKKLEEVAAQAGVTQAEMAHLMTGMAIGAEIAAWVMRHQLGRGGVVVNEDYIKRIGPAIISNLDIMNELVRGLPSLDRWSGNGR